MGRFWAFALVALAAIAVVWYRSEVFSASAAGPQPRLAVVTGGPGPFWRLIANGAKAAASDLDVELDIKMPEQNENRELQVKLLAALDLARLDGIALSPLDAGEDTPLINRMAEKTLVVTFDSDAPLSARHSYVGTSNIAAGRSCAETVKQAIPGGGKIAVIMANLSKQNMIERKAGFAEAISQTATADGSQPQYEVIDYLTDDGSQQKASELISELLNAHTDLACLVGMNSPHGPILVRALKEANRLGEVKIVAFDEESETLDGIESGDIFATIAQDPYQYGYQAVRTLADFSRGSESQRPLSGSRSTYSISTTVVNKDNVASFKSQLQSRLEER